MLDYIIAWNPYQVHLPSFINFFFSELIPEGFGDKREISGITEYQFKISFFSLKIICMFVYAYVFL